MMKMAIKKKTKKERIKDRVYLEARIIGLIIYDSTHEDARKAVAGAGINWRQLHDKRHKVIWRALEKLDLLSLDDRMKIIEEEAYAGAAPAAGMNDVPGEDRVRGDPGSAQAKAFTKKLIEESSGLCWLERELEKVGALRLAGGKEYLRALAELGENVLTSLDDLLRDFRKV
jgi:hypothetical protein